MFTFYIRAHNDAKLDEILKEIKKMANDVTQLKAKVAELKVKSDEVVATLVGLAQAVVDLKNSTDIQKDIDAVTADAQVILDNLTTAEDSADDQLPPVTPPTP